MRQRRLRNLDSKYEAYDDIIIPGEISSLNKFIRIDRMDIQFSMRITGYINHIFNTSQKRKNLISQVLFNTDDK